MAWSLFERAVEQHIPRQEERLGIECVLDMPMDTMVAQSLQKTLIRLSIHL